MSRPEDLIGVPGLLLQYKAFVLLFALFSKSRSKSNQVLNSVLRFRHSHSPGEDGLVKALLTCLCKINV